MFQRDYIMRLIEMMGDLMRRIAELMSDLNRMRLLNDACRRHAGLSLETAESLNSQSLLEMLGSIPRLMVSELLYIRAHSFSLSVERQEDCLLKCLRLLSSLWNEGSLCELRADRLAEIKMRVQPLLTADDLLYCARFFAQAECYDEMENALFQAAEHLPVQANPSALRTEGTAMLTQAASAPPEALSAVKMTVQELLEAADEFARLWDDSDIAPAK